MKTLRQCVGIDCSKDTLDVAISFLKEDFRHEVQATEVFKNNDQGFKRMMKWMKKLCLKEIPCQVLIEATGVYHERLAYNLVKNGFELAIVLPNRIRNYCRSTDIRTITDKISAKQIAEFGLVKKLDNWVMPDEVFRYLKSLCRERAQLLKEKTVASNQQHAYNNAAWLSKEIEKRSNRRIKFLTKQIAEIEQDMRTVLDAHPVLKKKVEMISSIKGVGWLTIVTIVAETDGFNLIRNCKQLVCYAGYDVVVKDSGTSVKSKPRMSHKGNKHIRAALHFPAITAVKCNEPMKKLYIRLYERQKVKMKSYVAVQRKLLVLIYTLWKKDTEFHPQYQSVSHKILEQPIEAALTELDRVRPCDCSNLNTKIKNNFQLSHEISKT